jgi:predicted Zn-dependent peptidase
VLAFENTGAVARYAANQKIVFGDSIDPDEAITRLDAVTLEEVREAAASVDGQLAVACVGPHASDEF